MRPTSWSGGLRRDVTGTNGLVTHFIQLLIGTSNHGSAITYAPYYEGKLFIVNKKIDVIGDR